MPTTKTAAALAAALLAAATGCGKARPIVDESRTAAAACTGCHGDATRPEASALLQAAPPRTATGASPGAHQVHLHAGPFRSAIDCAECHVVPTFPEHQTGKIEVTFGPLATSGGAAGTYAGGTCAVYCHGATLNAGGATTAPSWTGSGLNCSSCHGDPPPSHAPSSTQCSTCHPGTVNADGSINVAGGLHINGQVDVANAHPAGWADPTQHGYAANKGISACQACHGTDFDGGTTGVSCNACHASNGQAAWQANCTFCHGTQLATYTAASLAKAAPPVGTQGETATTTRAVGAHQAHLTPGPLSSGVACTDCHAIPADLTHVTGTATVTFGAGATQGGARPTWNGVGCAATYCHGSTLNAGGTHTTPVWTGGSAEAACGSCHGAPPPAPHPSSADCGSCHTGYTATSVNPATHIDGVVQVASLTCTSCHGDATRAANPAAPPLGTHGETATTSPAVGAHQAHLAPGPLSNGVACAECHVVPTSTAHSNGVVDLTWGTLASSGGATPSWSATSLSCANYCHGQTLNAGGTHTSPVWTGGSAEAACGSCHGLPPPPPHTTSADCGSCHAGYTATSVNPATHINGTVDVTSAHPAGWSDPTQHGYTVNRQGLSTCKTCHGSNLDGVGGTGPSCDSCHSTAGVTAWWSSCTFCHGNATTGVASPPVDTQGGSLTSNVSVGAHAVHVGTALMTGMTCAQCHPDRTGSNVITDPTHIDGNGIAEVTFGALAKTGGAAATYTRTSATQASCATVYCHGGYTGGANATVSWTSTVALSCTSCHGLPPSTGHHSDHSGRSCGDCHPGYTRTTVNPATHIDGSKEVGNNITSWNPTTKQCVGCHGSATW